MYNKFCFLSILPIPNIQTKFETDLYSSLVYERKEYYLK